MSETLAVLIVAPCIGSFLGVLIRRIPAGRDLAFGRSHCDSCDAVLGPRELVPLLTYALQKGRCRHCGAPIGRFHLAVELAALAIGAASAWLLSGREMWVACGLGWWLLALGWIDAVHFELPDILTLPLILAGLAATEWLDPGAVFDHALGAALGYGVFWAVAAIYRRLRGRDGLGEGDARLLAAAGAWLGWRALPAAILVSALAALGFAVASALGGRRLAATTALPYGPFIAVAIWLLWLWPAIVSAISGTMTPHFP